MIRTSGWKAYICNDESAYRSWRSETKDVGCLQTASLTMNIIVGDAIVWWRASVLCQWTGRSRYAIHFVCFMVLSSTFATSVADTCNACGPSTAHLSAPGYHPGQLFSGTMLGASASVLTLLSNIITVALTLYKARAHVKLRNMGASRERRATQVLKTLALLVESGLIYCAIWLLVSIYQLGTNVYTIYEDVVDIDYWKDVPVTFWTVMSYFVSGALIPIIAIYPMAIIVMVALKKPPGTSVSVSMPASSALVARRRETHAELLRDGTSYPMMTLSRGRGPSILELAEEESIDGNSVAKRQVIEIV
ncbi:hypothetical protein C8Q74DRAFT_1243079 [Fomes fomentarius]|nr:hypothetical protein C8Q74DRAFT_1243079 [Fomes fomentarius]